MTKNFVFDTNVLLTAMLSPRSASNAAFIKAIRFEDIPILNAPAFLNSF